MRKFRAYTYALMIGAFVFFNLNCEKTLLPVDSSKKIEYEQGSTEASVIIKLFDNHSMTPIAGATVSIIGVDSSVSDSKGMVIFDSIKVGDYLVSCSKTGYESIYDELSLTIDSNSNTVPIVNQSSDHYFLAKKGAAVKGNIYYQKDGKFFPAIGAKIECRLNSPFFQIPLRTTNSVNGTYTFTDLPEYTDYIITVSPFSDGVYTYKQAASLACIGKSAGDTSRAEDIILDKFTDGKFIAMSNNLESMTISDAIILDFSEAVDTTKLGIDSIYVLIVESAITKRILVQKDWLNYNKRLTIKPFDGIWDPVKEYVLVVKKITSVTGKPLDNTNYFNRHFTPITSGVLGNVLNLSVYDVLNDTNKVDYNTSQIALEWSPLANALTYQVYQKQPSDSSWIFLKSVADTFTTHIPLTGSFTLGKRLKFIVLGLNSTSMSSFKTASILTVRDQIAPHIKATMQRSASQFNNVLNNSAYYIDISITSAYLPEPMDTTKKPVLKVKEASYFYQPTLTMRGDSTYSVSPNNFVWTWSTQQTGNLRLFVDAYKDGSFDTLKVDFTSVTDLAGNKSDTSMGAGYINIYPGL
ncbi:MAG TPA: carboxypeptidase-like regulatory domain-containing protein [Chitinispirillaceae bacterium]|nr:carboxypeptidase-like regulatory domain-containing protein [Chitinispirillaceae bacterium]